MRTALCHIDARSTIAAHGVPQVTGCTARPYIVREGMKRITYARCGMLRLSRNHSVTLVKATRMECVL